MGSSLLQRKTGKRATPLKLEYNNYFGFQETTRILPVLNATEYTLLINESFGAGGKEIPYPNITDLGQGLIGKKKFFKKHRYRIMILALEEVEISRLTRLDFQLLIRTEL